MKRKRWSPQSGPGRDWQGSPTEKLQLGWQDSKSFLFRDLVDLVGVLECLGIFQSEPSSEFKSLWLSLVRIEM